MTNENDDIIPWYLRIAALPFMAVSNLGDWWQERKARKEYEKKQ